MNWFMITAGRKWKEYKSYLKARYFDETLADEELMNRNIDKTNGARVNPNDWKFLINFWRSPDFEARSAIGKSNRGKVKEPHTSGSVSHACCRHNLGQQLGRTPRRDEVYIKTHTRKSGVPLKQASATITQLKAAVEAHPELKNRIINKGDVSATVCGLKEPRGRVRVLGLGPTPQEIGTPGLKSYLPTKFQMESLARQRAESDKAALERRVVEMEKLLEESRAREMANVESISQHGSNS